MSEQTALETPDPEPANDEPTRVWYRAAVRCAYVAGGFLLIVCSLLLLDYAARLTNDPLDSDLRGTAVADASEEAGVWAKLQAEARGLRRIKEPLDSDTYRALRAKVVADPADVEARETLRERDRLLRQNYFRHRRFTAMGVWLAAIGCGVLLASLKVAITLHRRLPSPTPADAPKDIDTKQSTIARWCVVGLGVAVVLAAVALNRAVPPELVALATASGPGAAPTAPPEAAKTDGNAGQPPAPTDEPDASWPTAEELAANWPRFRGPGGLGVSPAIDLPTSWNAESGEGILWKTAVPLPGNSSPVVWGDRLFLTGADEEQRVVMCYGTAEGKLLWQTEIPGTSESTAKPPEVSEDTGLAAPTAACDGRRVYAMFANGDLGAVDFEGKVVWSKSLGIPKNSYGHASSLAMWRDRVILQFDQGVPKDKLSRLMAFDGATGNEVWSVPRDVANSWPSPIVTEQGGVPQIITCADPFVIAYNAEDGSELWRCKCLRQDVGPSPVVAGDLLIVANEYPQLTAIRLGGKGDITDNEEFVLWTFEDNLPDSCSPIATAESVLVLASYGMLTCLEAKSGEVRWEWESQDMYSSSPTLVGDLVYLFGLESCHVLKSGDDAAEVVGQGSLGEECVTSPAFGDGRMFIRGKEHLFCIGKP